MSTQTLSVPRAGAPAPPDSRRLQLAAVARQMVPAFREVHRARRSISLAEGEILCRLREARTYQQLGDVRFSDFVRERLLLHPRTARRRLTVYCMMQDTPSLADPFLSGRLDAGQMLVLRAVLTPGNAPYWVHLATQLPLRELGKHVRRVRSETGRGEPEGDSEVDRERIDFLAPRSAGFAIEHGLETAQRVLGWDAPRDACLEAVLAEGASSLAAPYDSPPPEGLEEPRPLPPRPHLRSASRRRRPYPIRYLRKDLKRTRRVLAGAKRTLARVQRQISREPGLATRETAAGAGGDVRQPKTSSAAVLVQRYRALTCLENPLRALEARLIYCFFRLGVGALLDSEDDLATCRDLFGIGDRSARNLYKIGFAFEHCHPLADAFLQGKIGLTQVLALGRTLSFETPAWVKRAREITVRQLRREVRLRERLDQCAPYLAGFGPLPVPNLEQRLRRRLFQLGWTEGALDRELAERGLTCPPDASPDPAENPVVMRRLETLVDILAVEGCNRDGDPLPGKTLSVPGRHVRIVVWSRAGIREHWRQSLAAVRGRCGKLPPWAVAVLLVGAALEEWERIDPERIPTERRILERDDYRCQAPGCTSRKHLEVHHIVFRSRGGTDAGENLITLCHAHHHHAVHRRTLQVTGNAPHGLLWAFAGNRVYRGERMTWLSGPARQLRLLPAMFASHVVWTRE